MEEEKSKKGLYLFIIIFLLLCLGGSGFFIYKRIYQEPKKEEPKQEENIMTDNEAIALGEEMYTKLYEFLNSFPSETTYLKMDEYKKYETGGNLIKKLTENGLVYNNVYFLVENFEQKFYDIFSQNVVIDDVFKNNDTHYEYYPYRYSLVDEKYFIDSMCRANGQSMKFGNLTINNKTSDLIDYSMSISGEKSGCSENCEYENTKEMQLIKEEGTWKINKVSELSPCEVLEKDS